MAVALQPGPAMRVRADELGRGTARAGRTATARRRACRRSASQSAALASRWSAPRSTTGSAVGQRGGERGGLAVRQGEEDDVGLGEHVGGRRRRRRGPASCGRCGCRSVTGRPALLPAASGPTVEVGVGEQQAEQLAAGVAAGARDRCCHPHASTIHDPAWLCSGPTRPVAQVATERPGRVRPRRACATRAAGIARSVAHVRQRAAGAGADAVGQRRPPAWSTSS